ncbi:Hypothetical protein A7982_08791 [Minicystis rosea]|nr:Hypothetical protein A7982_08791 [Minicystis rosea]
MVTPKPGGLNTGLTRSTRPVGTATRGVDVQAVKIGEGAPPERDRRAAAWQFRDGRWREGARPDGAARRRKESPTSIAPHSRWLAASEGRFLKRSTRISWAMDATTLTIP